MVMLAPAISLPFLIPKNETKKSVLTFFFHQFPRRGKKSNGGDRESLNSGK
jgi:hypothetical protein